MFHEVIYTHCSQGIKLETREKLSGNGFKIYARDEYFLKTEKMDLSFLKNAMAMEQYYDKAKLMDDAYLYYVPDTMEPFLLCFHAFPFISGDTGYGKYLNQAFMGCFSSIYPCETLNEQKNWDAKEKGSNYYYINPPPENIKPKENLLTNNEKFDNVKRFIADGRTDALKSLVAFLISQYEKPVKERKYIVIVDESAKNIENWISAIEYAFSPKISASIPFATRMKTFDRNNYYAVNTTTKQYKEDAGSKDQNTEFRFRAMIIGVDLRDNESANSVRSLPNLPYVVLDGKKKEPLKGVDTSNTYYELITAFDDDHRTFCRVILQGLKKAKKEPSKEILDIYKIFISLTQKTPELNVDEVFSTLTTLMNYEPENFEPKEYKEMYTNVCSKIYSFLQTDLKTALDLYSAHLVPMAKAFKEDVELFRKFSVAICNLFIKKIDSKPENEENHDFLATIEKHGEFIKDLKNEVIEHEFDLAEKTLPSIIALAGIYKKCASDFSGESKKSFLLKTLKKCFKDDNEKVGSEIIKIILQNTSNLHEFVLSLVSKEVDEKFIKFIIDCLFGLEDGSFSSDATVLSLCDKLEKDEFASKIIMQLLAKRIENIVDIDNLGQFKIAINKKPWSKNLSDKELIINTRANKIIRGMTESFISNDKTEKLCINLNKKGWVASVIYEGILLLRLKTINTAEDFLEFRSSKCLSSIKKLINGKLSDGMDLDNKINDQLKTIVSNEIINNEEEFSTSRGIEKYCKMLNENGFDSFVKLALFEWIEHNDAPYKEKIKFINTLDKFVENVNSKKPKKSKEPKLDKPKLIELLEKLDEKINVLDIEDGKVSAKLLQMLTKYDPDLQCVNSVHAYALWVLDNRNKRKNLENELRKLCDRGFALLVNEKYIRKFTEMFLQSQPDEYEMMYIYNVFNEAQVKEYIRSFVNEIMKLFRKNESLCKKLLLSMKYDNPTSENQDIIDKEFSDAINDENQFPAKSAGKEVGKIVLKINDMWLHEYIIKMAEQRKIFKNKEEIEEYKNIILKKGKFGRD